MAAPPSSIPPKVAVIVLNYRGKDCLSPCLASLAALSYPEKDVIVVDNASRDGSLEAAKALFPNFVFVRNDENVGFAKGMNVGIRLALSRGAKYVWLFNNDALAEKKSLGLLVSLAEKSPKAGLFSPIITETAGGKLWFAAGRINFFRMRTEHAPVAVKNLGRESYESAYLTGCALLIKKEVIKKIGFLDERFFLYYEDTDYSLRAQEAGFRAVVVPAARVSHGEQSAQSSQKVYHLVYSGLLFFGKHATFPQRLYLALYVTIRRIKNVLECLFSGTRGKLVHRAYKEYFHDHSALLLPRLR